MLAALPPQAVCGVEDAAFQASVGFARHTADLQPPSREIVYPTALTIQCINNVGTGLLPKSIPQNIERRRGITARNRRCISLASVWLRSRRNRTIARH